MPAVTAAASAAWIRMSLQHGREHGYSCLVEGTFRSPATTLDTAVTFASAGYEVHVVALAVPAAVSRLGTLLRYYGAIAAGQSGRWTGPVAHDAGYQGTPRSLQALQEDPHVHRITIMNRGGATIYDTLTQPRTGAVGALTAERERTWTAAETAAFLQDFNRLITVGGRAVKAAAADVARLATPHVPAAAATRLAGSLPTAGRQPNPTDRSTPTTGSPPARPRPRGTDRSDGYRR